MFSTYVRRVDLIESLPFQLGKTPTLRKMISLQGDSSTDDSGEADINLLSEFTYAGPATTSLVQLSGPFYWSSLPSFPQGLGPQFWLASTSGLKVSVSQCQLMDEIPPIRPAVPALLTARVEKVAFKPLTLDSDERVFSWNLDGRDAQWRSSFSPSFYGVRLIVRSWGVDGQPTPGVRFNWELVGEMRFVAKGPESLTAGVPPAPPEP